MSPFNKTEECARFVIDTPSDPFILSEIAIVGQRYCFSCWIKSDEAASFTVRETSIDTSTTWTKYSAMFTATNTNVYLHFTTAGTYYIYHPQLELGTVATDWTPAPEDMDVSDELAETNERIQSVHEEYSELSVKIDGIEGSVSSVTQDVNNLTDEMTSVYADISDLKLTSTDLRLDFKNMVDNGVTKVTTETGFTFNRDGLTVDDTDSPTKTVISPDGMTVYKTDGVVSDDGTLPEVLIANSDGVVATDLNANTYLIIGGRSRFENYGTNRTGCFWIGG